MVRQRVFGILAGYEDQNDHDTLRSDGVFKLVPGRGPDGFDLASQPTLSRLTGAVLDRLTHRCNILESTGESCRLQDARRRRKGSRPKPTASPSSPADESAES